MKCDHGIDIDEYSCHICEDENEKYWIRYNEKMIKTIHKLTTGKFDKYKAKRTLDAIRNLIT